MNSKNFKPVISLIIPVYAVEEYLCRCLDSVVAQTYDNLEIILVDDGSPDNCGRICDEYADRDSRIKVIHQKNAGLSTARNVAMDLANGDFIGFVDSDDYLHPQMFEILLKNLLATGAYISVCNYLKVYNSNEPACKIESENTKILDKNAALRVMYGTPSTRQGFAFPEVGDLVWNKLYRKTLFDGLRFPRKYHEDTFLTPHLISRAETIVFSELPLYYYRQRNTSFSNVAYNLCRLDIIEANADRMALFREKFPEHYPHAVRAYLNSILLNYLSLVHSGLLNKKLKKQLKQKFIHAFRLPERKNLPLKMQFLCALFLCSPRLYDLTLRIRKLIVK